MRRDRALVSELVELTSDEDWLVAMRALDLVEKLAFEHPDWIAPYKRIFVGPLADSDKLEIRLQVVRALPLGSKALAARARQIRRRFAQ